MSKHNKFQQIYMTCGILMSYISAIFMIPTQLTAFVPSTTTTKKTSLHSYYYPFDFILCK